MSKHKKNRVWSWYMNPKLRKCREIEKFDEIFNIFGFPKKVRNRMAWLSNATGCDIIACDDTYSATKNEELVLYEALKHHIILCGS